MYIHNNNVSHRFQGLHDSVQTCHRFVYGIIGRFPPSDHDRTLSNGAIGYSVSKLVNRKRDALVHEVVQVDGVVNHFHHHANLPK